MLKNPYPGKFIVFEGPDGSGQTTQSSLLEKYISGLGKKVILTKEPTLDSKAGLEIKVILNHEKESTPEGLQKLFAEDRKEHLKKVIIPALKGGSIVISDRYFFSTFAFGSLGADLERLISINNDFILPDITFVMTFKPETSIERIANRGIKFTLFEKLESLKKVMENYKNLGNRFENMVFIDGDRAVNEIRKEIAEIALGIIR